MKAKQPLATLKSGSAQIHDHQLDALVFSLNAKSTPAAHRLGEPLVRLENDWRLADPQYVGFCTSNAPMSAEKPDSRGNPAPRWSKAMLVGLAPLLSAGLLAPMACVSVGPPLFASGCTPGWPD